ncbi:MAG: flagellar type III secretion system pore protein FliP [Thermoguttaceae bacterium]|nr:flagellar type III secretion system pore protein FliP [Thermoguttaceae bacterium]
MKSLLGKPLYFLVMIALLLGTGDVLRALDPPSVPSLDAQPLTGAAAADSDTAQPPAQVLDADLPGTAGAADVPGAADLSAAPGAGGDWSREISELFAPTSGGRVGGTVKIAILLSVLSLVPAILMMTTSFVRIITVLSILRQGLGTGQTPPTQVFTAIAVFMTLLVMPPPFPKIWDGAIRPYSDKQITFTEAVQRGEVPMRTFLWKQIERSGNTDVIYQLLEYVPNAQVPKYYEDIPWRVLLPAFMMSELKIAFLIGFQILLPFLIIDLIVSGVTVSMGMMMLPPALVSLPLKLMLFVLVDGWTLVVKTLLDGFVVNI